MYNSSIDAKNIETVCQNILSTHARSFSWAAAMMPRKTRIRTAITYAFCRIIDDAVDEASSQDDAKSAIYALREDLRKIEPDNAIVRAFRQINQLSPVSLEAADYLIEGVCEDIGEVRIKDDKALLLYCYKVASTPGLMMCPIIGVQNSDALPFAVDLGIAMQITNICRDIAEDAAIGRVYLPQTRLQKLGIDHTNIIDGTANPDLMMVVVKDLMTLAESYYASGDRGMLYIPFWSRISVMVASHLYREIGHKILNTGDLALRQRTVVSPWRKSRRMLTTVFEGLISGILPRFAKLPHSAELHSAIAGFPATDQA